MPWETSLYPHWSRHKEPGCLSPVSSRRSSGENAFPLRHLQPGSLSSYPLLPPLHTQLPPSAEVQAWQGKEAEKKPFKGYNPFTVYCSKNSPSSTPRVGEEKQAICQHTEGLCLCPLVWLLHHTQIWHTALMTLPKWIQTNSWVNCVTLTPTRKAGHVMRTSDRIKAPVKDAVLCHRIAPVPFPFESRTSF